LLIIDLFILQAIRQKGKGWEETKERRTIRELAEHSLNTQRTLDRTNNNTTTQNEENWQTASYRSLTAFTIIIQFDRQGRV
jgi:hypothetical protein